MTAGIRRVSVAVAAVGAVCLVAAQGGGLAVAGGIIDFGPVDEFTISQPTVQIKVGGFDSLLNEYLLDTGASGILAGKSSSDDLVSLGLETEATYVDFGVAGPESTRVSKPYAFSFAGTDGVPTTLPSVRMQTSAGNFGFYSGIAGMPLMAGRTVALNLAGQADPAVLQIGVAFGGGTAAWPAPTAHQYDVPLSTRLFPATGQQNPTDPLPANAPLPFAPVEVQYGATRRQASFLLDTGAQQCILSRSTAFSLGLDVNGNGSLDDEALTFQTVAGVGGTVDIPVLRIDSLAIKAAGADLMFRDVPVGIIDIDDALPGVLGMNVLNCGWDLYGINVFLGITPPGPPGAFGGVDFDFRAVASGTAHMRLAVTSSRDAFISQGPITCAVAAGTQTLLQAGHTAIGGTGSITKTGTGTLVLDAVNTVTGTTFVQAGTLRIAAPNALFGSPVVVQPGARLELTGTDPARLPRVTLAGGTLAASHLAIDGTTGISRLTLAGGQVVGQPAVLVGVAGLVEIAAPAGSLSVASLSVDEAARGLVDLGTGRLSVAAGGLTPQALLADLAAGMGTGGWTGVGGITSSAAAADLARGLLRTVGWCAADGGGLMVGYAAPGDANLDGQIDVLDTAAFLSGGRLDSGVAAVWAEGDFNYDGFVDILDAADFSGVQLFDRGSYLPAGGTAAMVAVPEPVAAPVAMACAAAALLRGRRARGRRAQ